MFSPHFSVHQHYSALLFTHIEPIVVSLQHLRITIEVSSHGVLFINIIYKFQQNTNIHTLKNSKSTSSDTLVFVLLYNDYDVTSCLQVSVDIDINLCELWCMSSLFWGRKKMLWTLIVCTSTWNFCLTSEPLFLSYNFSISYLVNESTVSSSLNWLSVLVCSPWQDLWILIWVYKTSLTQDHTIQVKLLGMWFVPCSVPSRSSMGFKTSLIFALGIPAFL